jgi:hypothetical protein
VRVVLDAGGADRRVDRSPHVCGQLLDAGRQEKIQIIISPQLLAELTLVLGREKFRRWADRTRGTPRRRSDRHAWASCTRTRRPNPG